MTQPTLAPSLESLAGGHAPTSLSHLAAIAAAIAALAVVPVSYTSLVVMLAVGAASVIGMRTPEVRVAAGVVRPAVAGLVLLAGLGAFGFVRLTGAGFGVRLTALGVTTIVVSAVAEEAFFRGYLHGWLRAVGLGVLATGAVTASIFALIHVPIYGVWVLPIDLAAGAVLAWQREVSGTWLVPAVTHVAANLMQLG